MIIFNIKFIYVNNIFIDNKKDTMSQRKFLYGPDYLFQIPKDIQELIIYETKPEDLDILCQINEEMSILCQNNRIIKTYLDQHNLSIPQLKILDDSNYMWNDSEFEKYYKYLYNMLHMKSLVLLRYILSMPIYGSLNDISNFISYLFSNNFSDDYIIEILSAFKLTQEDFGMLNILTNESIIRNRPKVINWLKLNNFYIYQEALILAIRKNNNNLFDEVFDLVTIHNYPIDWYTIASATDKSDSINLHILKRILSIKDSDIKDYIIDNIDDYISDLDRLRLGARIKQEKIIQMFQSYLDNF